MVAASDPRLLRKALLLGVSLSFGLNLIAHAEDVPPRQDAAGKYGPEAGTVACRPALPSCSAGSTPPAAARWPLAQLHWYPSNLAPLPAPVTPESSAHFAWPEWYVDPLLDYAYSDSRNLIRQLAASRELRLLTLWHHDTARLFLGVGKDGVAGLNFYVTPRRRSDTSEPAGGARRPIVFDPYRDTSPGRR